MCVELYYTTTLCSSVGCDSEDEVFGSTSMRHYWTNYHVTNINGNNWVTGGR